MIIEMQTFTNIKYPLGCVIILIIFANFWETISLQLFEPSAELFPEQVPQQEAINETVSEKMKRKRKILERGCSMMAELYEMSQNGTSYEILIDWHARIHDLEYPIRRVLKMTFQVLTIQRMRSTNKFKNPSKCFQRFMLSTTSGMEHMGIHSLPGSGRKKHVSIKLLKFFQKCDTKMCDF